MGARVAYKLSNKVKSLVRLGKKGWKKTQKHCLKTLTY